jgi:hypothetical protein
MTEAREKKEVHSYRVRKGEPMKMGNPKKTEQAERAHILKRAVYIKLT